jgi:hypothetical protein
MMCVIVPTYLATSLLPSLSKHIIKKKKTPPSRQRAQKRSIPIEITDHSHHAAMDHSHMDHGDMGGGGHDMPMCSMNVSYHQYSPIMSYP